MAQFDYFMGGTTAKGYVQFYDNAVEQLDHVIYLDGGFTTIISPLLERLANDYSSLTAVETVRSHLMPTCFEAVILPDYRIGIFDRTKMQQKRLSLPGLKEHLIYFGDGYEFNRLNQHHQQLLDLKKTIHDIHYTAIQHFERALDNHEKVESVYSDYLNIRRANEHTNELLDALLKDKQQDRVASVKHRYLGAATPDGPVDYVLDLTEDIKNRYFIKGRSGTGKSTMLRKIAHEAHDRGFDVEVYHCGFDPGSLDMVIVRELNFAIFDATPPHQHKPARQGDLIFDVYERFIDGHPDALHREKLIKYKQMYQEEMAEAKTQLTKLQEKQQEFETIYREALSETFFEESYHRVRHWVEEAKPYAPL
ncbi:hypothetical protein [Alkalibacillus salilacus]|uniref:NACHT domain-containing protein n=1 Tax=Alkalibacillus salilacus TaxID=284582 RepID=A0ABT9VAT2_9BACI|nr:hypothetical protein [Alkalibacillus salilacus]MDQ0158063.1 hypothetical protein [Alkalibacillus salilacus]